MSRHSQQQQPWTSGLHGGRRPRLGRYHRDTVRLECTIPRAAYDELTRLRARDRRLPDADRGDGPHRGLSRAGL